MSPEIEAIKLLPPLIGGRDSNTNKYSGKLLQEFDVALRWEPYPGVRKYLITIFDKYKKMILKKSVDGSTYSFNKKKVYVGEIYYTVSGETTNGFKMHSPIRPFIFNFLSPELTNPLNQTSVKTAHIEKTGVGVLFTWQKTNFTESYELELASDATFSNVIKRQGTTGNFLLISGIRPGQYWWRVRSIAVGELKSTPGVPFKITVLP